MKKFEVLGRSGQILGYVYGTDIDHAYSLACSMYRCQFYLVGPGAFALGGAA